MPRPPYIGDPPSELEKRSDEIVVNKPNTDHVVRTWKPRGRPTTLTQETIDSICDLIAGGCTIPIAASACGFATQWANWGRKAKEHLAAGYEPGFEPGQSPYLVWLDCVTQAKASFVANACLQITAGHPQWKSQAWILERRLPDMWQERKSVSVAVKTEREEAASKSTQELEQELAQYALASTNKTE
jgi:hypothetical protein